jgi:hypothetical protein
MAKANPFAKKTPGDAAPAKGKLPPWMQKTDQPPQKGVPGAKKMMKSGGKVKC